MSAVYLIRHGQASFGSANYDQLSALGRDQAGVLGSALRSRVPEPDAVFCGALQRHRQTAEHCLAAMGLSPEWTEDADLNEYDHIEIVNRYLTPQEVSSRLSSAPDRGMAFEKLFVDALRRWQDAAHHAEYAENWPRFRDRCLAALDRICSSVAGGKRNALVFTSGGVISTIALELLDFPLERYGALNWRLANAGITKLVVGREGRFLSTLNEHGHFEGVSAGMLTYR
jgi:broad specificity phosphatase PhoE